MPFVCLPEKWKISPLCRLRPAPSISTTRMTPGYEGCLPASSPPLGLYTEYSIQFIILQCTCILYPRQEDSVVLGVFIFTVSPAMSLAHNTMCTVHLMQLRDHQSGCSPSLPRYHVSVHHLARYDSTDRVVYQGITPQPLDTTTFVAHHHPVGQQATTLRIRHARWALLYCDVLISVSEQQPPAEPAEIGVFSGLCPISELPSRRDERCLNAGRCSKPRTDAVGANGSPLEE